MEEESEVDMLAFPLGLKPSGASLRAEGRLGSWRRILPALLRSAQTEVGTDVRAFIVSQPHGHETTCQDFLALDLLRHLIEEAVI
jgi:hypothetical protein